MEVITVIQWALPALTVAAAYGGTRQALNGTREKVKDIKTTLDEHIIDGNIKHESMVQRVAIVETKVDALK
jgi:hypothetical protein